MIDNIHKTRDFLGKEWEISCMGCSIGNDLMIVPGGIIKKTHYFCVHQDPLIPLEGFIVIASLKHIQSIAEMNKEEYIEFSNLVRIVHLTIKEVTKVKYLSIIQEESSSHFHLWFFPWTKAVIEKYGKPSLTKIRNIMQDYKSQLLKNTEWKKLEKSIKKIKMLLS